MAQILDYSAGYPGGAAVRNAGYDGVIRYLRKEGASAVRPITAAELADMIAHGRTIALVYQHVSRSRPAQGRAAGRHDAQWARDRAREIGTTDPFIYLAVDFDADPATVRDYFIGAGEILGVARLGAYGGYRVLTFLFDHGLIGKGWQTAAWSGGRRESRAHLFQRIGQVNVGGISCDVNDILKPNYGQIQTQEDDMAGEIADGIFTYVAENTARLLGAHIHGGDLLINLEGRQRKIETTITRIAAAVTELQTRPIVDIDEAALAAELQARGWDGATATEVKEIIRATFARAGQPDDRTTP